MREESDRVPLGIMELTNDTRDSKAGGVGMETNWEIGIEVTKDRSGGKTMFEFLKGYMSLRGPVKLLILAEEGSNGSSYTRVTLNKTTVKVGEAQKDLNVLNRGGNRPFCNGDDVIRFHRNTTKRNNET